MIANYHTHTPRCNHATGSEREYVEAALQAGLQILGFSDHSPCVFPGNYVSWHRMKLEELEDYVAAVLALREEYKDRIQIPLGLELEYFPGLMPQLLPILREQPIDYLLLGQHFLGDEIGEPYCGHATDDKKILERYCDQTIEGMQTGLFLYLAHPDLIYFTGDDHTYRNQMRRICREAKGCGMPLEWNLLGQCIGRNYPDMRFWEMAAEEGCDVILGWDAHAPNSMGNTAALEFAQDAIRRLDMHLLDTVPIG
jgi:histidinol-phosphatase (PHP family)